jgi:hypothetical protein
MVLNATKPESALNSRLRNPIFDITPDPTLVTLPPTSLPVDAVFHPDYIMFPTISHLQQLPNPRTKHRRRHQTFQQSPTSRVGTTCFFVTSNLATPPKLTLFQNPEVELILSSNGCAKDCLGSFGALIASQTDDHHSTDAIFITL